MNYLEWAIIISCGSTIVGLMALLYLVYLATRERWKPGIHRPCYDEKRGAYIIPECWSHEEEERYFMAKWRRENE